MTDSEQYGSRDNSERSGGDRRRGSGGPGGWSNRGNRDRSWQDRGDSRDRRDDRREGGRNDRRDEARGGDRRNDRRSFDGRRDDRGGDRRDYRRDDRRYDRDGDRRDDRRRDGKGGEERRQPRRWDDRPRADRSDARSGDRKGQGRQFDRFQDRKDGHRSERRSGDWERKRETGNRSRTWDDRGGSRDRRDDRGGDRPSSDGRRDDRGGDRRDFRRDDRTNDRRDDRGGRSDGRRSEGFNGGDRRENRRWDDRPRNDRNERRSYGDRTNDRRNDRGGRSDDRRSFEGRRDARGGDRRDFRRDDRGGRPDGRKDFRRDDRSGGRRDDRRRDNFGGDDRRRDADREERMTRRDLNDLDKPRFIAPDIDEDVTGREVDKPTRRQLEALEPRNAERVAQHLVMAARYLEVDPAFALEHANAAVRKAGRIAVVREATGVAAYAAEDYALALKELRTHRRISGSEEHLPLIVDCQRALGKVDKALEEAQSSAAEKLDAAGKVELAIVVSGIHGDAGDNQASLEALQIPQLDKNRGFSYSPRLFRSYAEALRGVGRDKESLSWERQAIVAEAALGLGQFSEPEIVDLGDDIDLDAAKETVREAGERHSETAGPSGDPSDVSADDAAATAPADGHDSTSVADDAMAGEDATSHEEIVEEPTAPVEAGESHTVAPASESGEPSETGDDSENHDR